MGPFEYLLLLASVILALAVSDVAVSLNRLLEAGGRVRWDWLAPMAAVLAFLKIVTQWWAWFSGASLARDLTFGMYLAVLVGAVLLFLMASASLPDHVDAAGIDLRHHYRSASRRFWLLFAAHWIVATGTTMWIEIVTEHAHVSPYAPAFLLVPAGLALAFLRSRVVHTFVLAGLIALYLGLSFTRTLGH